ECIGVSRRLFDDAQSADGRQTAIRTEAAGCGLVRCPADRSLASAIHASEARATETRGQRCRKMTARATVGKEKAVRDLRRAGRPRGRRADRPRVGSLPPPNRYLRKSVDSGNHKLIFCRFQPDESFPLVNRAIATSFVDGGGPTSTSLNATVRSVVFCRLARYLSGAF